MSRVIDSLEREQLRSLPPFQAGDRVRVHFQVVEGGRRRTQVFEGIVIKRQGSGARETFTVRKQSFGVGVERTFPAHSPKLERIELAARGDVRRAKLYYLRERIGRGARVRERRWMGEQPEAAVPPGAEPAAAAGEAEAAGAPPAAPQPDADATAGAMPADEEAPRPGEEELAEATAEEEGEAPTPEEEPAARTAEGAGTAPSDEEAAESAAREDVPAAPEDAGDRSDSS